MKNLFYKSRLAIFLLAATNFLLPQFITAQNSGLTITATGTGKTTGDIVAMTIHNPTANEIKESIGPYFIPSEGGYQPYITLVKPVTVAPGQTININLQGFCADISKPPAGEKYIFKPITDWIRIDGPPAGQIPLFNTSSNPDTHPVEAAPFLLEAVNRIGNTYDSLKKAGVIVTPFSGTPEKEKEAVIQQTFWIYTSSLRQNPYTKEQFTTRTYTQFLDNTNINPITLPKDQKDKIDKGIDDFWNTFQLVGTEAKVLNVPTKPEDDKMINNISGPVQTTCACGECRVAGGQRIHIHLSQYGEAFLGDSIPWTINQIFIDQPFIYSTCVPEECLPSRTYEIRTTITYKDKRHPSPPAIWKKYEFKVASPVMEHQGEMLIEFRYKCYCAGKLCAEGMTSRKVFFIEKNDCCDKIRANNNGQLSFAFKGGSAQIKGNTLSVNLPGCDIPPFVFNFNLEALFCNLTDDLVFSQLISMAQSNLSSGNISEFFSSQDLSLGGVSTDPNMTKFYGFGFSKKVNDNEMSVFISIDKEKCAFDMSIFCDSKLHEFTAPPYLSPAQLSTMANGLAAPTSGQSWTNAMLILSHLARADEHNQGAAYKNALNVYLAKVLNQVSTLLNTTKNQQLQGQLKALRTALTEAAGRGGDFKLLDNVLDKMMPVANAMN